MHWVLLIGCFFAAFVGFMTWAIRALSSTEDRRPKIARLAEQASSHQADLIKLISQFSDLELSCPNWRTGQDANSQTLRRLDQRKEYLKQLLRYELDEISDVRQRQAALDVLKRQAELEQRLNQIVSEVEGTLAELEREHNSESQLTGIYAETLSQHYPEKAES